MKFSIANLGPVKSAEITLAPLTVVCGKNNTGKTYLSYALFGLIDYMKTAAMFPFRLSLVDELLERGTATIRSVPTQQELDNFTKLCCADLQAILPLVFAASPKHFKGASLDLHIGVDELKIPSSVVSVYTSGSAFSLTVQKQKNAEEIVFTLIVDDMKGSNRETLKTAIQMQLGRVIRKIYTDGIMSKVMFASAERTGSLIFRDELSPSKGNFVPRNIFDKLGINDTVEFMASSVYPLPIIDNIKFVKNLRSISVRTSPLSKKHPELISAFDMISGGVYSVNDKGVFFSPVDNPKIALSMEETSSSARSLVVLSFWLRHLATKDSMLMIDEPEMNLHPESQRRLARWIAMLVNCGVKVFVTTHSDYFIKELNTLIMMFDRRRRGNIAAIMEEYAIDRRMLLQPDKVKVYVASRQGKQQANGLVRLGDTSIAEAEADKHYGFAVDSFDNTIEDINNLQSRILFNG